MATGEVGTFDEKSPPTSQTFGNFQTWQELRPYVNDLIDPGVNPAAEWFHGGDAWIATLVAFERMTDDLLDLTKKLTSGEEPLFAGAAADAFVEHVNGVVEKTQKGVQDVIRSANFGAATYEVGTRINDFRQEFWAIVDAGHHLTDKLEQYASAQIDVIYSGVEDAWAQREADRREAMNAAYQAGEHWILSNLRSLLVQLSQQYRDLGLRMPQLSVSVQENLQAASTGTQRPTKTLKSAQKAQAATPWKQVLPKTSTDGGEGGSGQGTGNQRLAGGDEVSEEQQRVEDAINSKKNGDPEHDAAIDEALDAVDDAYEQMEEEGVPKEFAAARTEAMPPAPATTPLSPTTSLETKGLAPADGAMTRGTKPGELANNAALGPVGEGAGGSGSSGSGGSGSPGGSSPGSASEAAEAARADGLQDARNAASDAIGDLMNAGEVPTESQTPGGGAPGGGSPGSIGGLGPAPLGGLKSSSPGSSGGGSPGSSGGGSPGSSSGGSPGSSGGGSADSAAENARREAAQDAQNAAREAINGLSGAGAGSSGGGGPSGGGLGGEDLPVTSSIDPTSSPEADAARQDALQDAQEAKDEAIDKLKEESTGDPAADRARDAALEQARDAAEKAIDELEETGAGNVSPDEARERALEQAQKAADDAIKDLAEEDPALGDVLDKAGGAIGDAIGTPGGGGGGDGLPFEERAEREQAEREEAEREAAEREEAERLQAERDEALADAREAADQAIEDLLDDEAMSEALDSDGDGVPDGDMNRDGKIDADEAEALRDDALADAKAAADEKLDEMIKEVEEGAGKDGLTDEERQARIDGLKDAKESADEVIDDLIEEGGDHSSQLSDFLKGEDDAVRSGVPSAPGVEPLTEGVRADAPAPLELAPVTGASVAGVPQELSTVGAGSAAQPGGSGMPMSPPMGGGGMGGQGDRDRERNTWIVGEEGMWGDDAEHVVASAPLGRE